jgi:hypothetical protein
MRKCYDISYTHFTLVSSGENPCYDVRNCPAHIKRCYLPKKLGKVTIFNRNIIKRIEIVWGGGSYRGP